MRSQVASAVCLCVYVSLSVCAVLCVQQYPECNAPQDSIVNKLSQIGEIIEHAISFPRGLKHGSTLQGKARRGEIREGPQSAVHKALWWFKKGDGTR